MNKQEARAVWLANTLKQYFELKNPEALSHYYTCYDIYPLDLYEPHKAKRVLQAFVTSHIQASPLLEELCRPYAIKEDRQQNIVNLIVAFLNENEGLLNTLVFQTACLRSLWLPWKKVDLAKAIYQTLSLNASERLTQDLVVRKFEQALNDIQQRVGRVNLIHAMPDEVQEEKNAAFSVSSSVLAQSQGQNQSVQAAEKERIASDSPMDNEHYQKKIQSLEVQCAEQRREIIQLREELNYFQTLMAEQQIMTSPSINVVTSAEGSAHGLPGAHAFTFRSNSGFSFDDESAQLEAGGGSVSLTLDVSRSLPQSTLQSEVQAVVVKCMQTWIHWANQVEKESLSPTIFLEAMKNQWQQGLRHFQLLEHRSICEDTAKTPSQQAHPFSSHAEHAAAPPSEFAEISPSE